MGQVRNEPARKVGFYWISPANDQWIIARYGYDYGSRAFVWFTFEGSLYHDLMVGLVVGGPVLPHDYLVRSQNQIAALEDHYASRLKRVVRSSTIGIVMAVTCMLLCIAAFIYQLVKL
jgi:hypothetical protein